MSETLEYTCDPKPRPENTIQVQPMYHLHISIICPHCRQETLTPHPAMSAKTSPVWCPYPSALRLLQHHAVHLVAVCRSRTKPSARGRQFTLLVTRVMGAILLTPMSE